MQFLHSKSSECVSVCVCVCRVAGIRQESVEKQKRKSARISVLGGGAGISAVGEFGNLCWAGTSGTCRWAGPGGAGAK